MKMFSVLIQGYWTCWPGLSAAGLMTSEAFWPKSSWRSLCSWRWLQTGNRTQSQKNPVQPTPALMTQRPQVQLAQRRKPRTLPHLRPKTWGRRLFERLLRRLDGRDSFRSYHKRLWMSWDQSVPETTKMSRHFLQISSETTFCHHHLSIFIVCLLKAKCWVILKTLHMLIERVCYELFNVLKMHLKSVFSSRF